MDEEHPDEEGRTKSLSCKPTFALAAASLVLAVGVVWTLWQAHNTAGRGTPSLVQTAAAWPRTPWKTCNLT